MSLPTDLKLPSGAKIPIIGLGTWQAAPNEVAMAVKVALENGYTHIDGAAIYKNETEVGQGLKDSGLKREDVFLTSKLWNDCHRPEKVKPALQKTLKDLNTSYVDLYLMHFPLAFEAGGDQMGIRDALGKVKLDPTVTLEDTWKAMEALVDEGLAKHIGVSNCNIENVKRILKVARKGMLACNQIELHPYLPQDELVDFCKKEGIVVTSYSPLGSSGKTPCLIKDKTVIEIAEKNKMDAGQVLISWAVQRGTVVIPKSVKPERIISNRKIAKLPDDDFEKLNKLHKTAGVHRFVDTNEIFGHNVY